MTPYNRYRITYTDKRVWPEAPWNVVTVQAATAMLASRVLTDCGLSVLDIVTLPDPEAPDTPTAEVTYAAE